MIRKSLLAAALACAGFAGQAAPVVVNFQSTPFDGGSLIGQSISGQFSYDDATLDAGTWSLPLLSLSFSLGGQGYTLDGAEAGTTGVFFDAGNLVGVNAVYSGAARSVELSPAFGAPYVFYQSSVSDYGYANLSFSTAAVPEPESYALLLVGLGALAVVTRRKA
jgi:hypothetical protein